jgi:hypothetical protein
VVQSLMGHSGWLCQRGLVDNRDGALSDRRQQEVLLFPNSRANGGGWTRFLKTT